MHTKRLLTVSAVAVLCVSGLAACGGDDDDASVAATTTTTATTSADSSAGGKIEESKPPIRFALVSVKVPGADLLSSFEAGAEAATKQINAAGGFGGRKVEIESCNSQLQTTVATTCARKTIAKKPVAEFGCDPSAWAQSGLQIYAKAEIPSFNCPNTDEELNNPWSFAINPSQRGQRTAMARYLCTRPEVKTVAAMTNDLPGEAEALPRETKAILEGCGKAVSYTQFPLAGGDLTPYVAKAMKIKPDFVMLTAAGPVAIPLFKLLAQNGIPASKITLADTAFDYENFLEPTGTLFDGAYSQQQFVPWGSDDPEVAEYLKAMEGSSMDARNPTTQWSYATVMFFYEAAKEIGFDTFDSASLAKFMDTADGFKIPLSRKVVNPGPKGTPQQKQPYVLITQYEKGKFTPVSGGDEGWFLGY